MSLSAESKTYLPLDGDAVARTVSALEHYLELQSREENPRYALVGPEGEVELPREAHEILTQVVAGMRSGQAIVVTPQSLRLTTQQAADLLGVSRPTVVKFIESGELDCERNSNRRVLLLKDVMAFRAARRERQLAAIAATSADDDVEVDAQQLQGLLKEARAANAQRRGRRAQAARQTI